MQLVALQQHFQQDQALEQAKKLTYTRSKCNSGGTGADEEVDLSLADVVIEDEAKTEE